MLGHLASSARGERRVLLRGKTGSREPGGPECRDGRQEGAERRRDRERSVHANAQEPGGRALTPGYRSAATDLVGHCGRTAARQVSFTDERSGCW
jgi:hypothetical protein